ncbi:MAG: 2Fe-2S iron-sulfur cluster-binding protein [Chloroflexota bacterium]|nr:2Fe-2S iron-sulfur cluster-binding protein [Chloroflexota bacterium]
MIRLNIDGKDIWAKEGSTILEAAQLYGIEIPTLCHHPVLTPYGACRLCSVEIIQKGRSRVVISCLYPVSEGLEVKVNSERVARLRRSILELLLARCSKSEKIRELAREVGISEPRFKVEDDDCILCGLCVRACREISEKKILAFVGRGTQKEVAAPFFEPSPECIECGACAYLCPTGAIRYEDGKLIFPWMKKTSAVGIT